MFLQLHVTTHISRFFLPLSFFIPFASRFASVPFSIYYHMLKVSELDIVSADLLWFIVSDLFVSRAAIA